MWSTPSTSPDNSAGTDKFTVTPRSGRQQNERLTTTDPLPRPASSYLSDLPGEHNGGHGAGTQFHGPPEKINVGAMLKEVNQNFPDSGFESYLRLEQQIADTPGNYKGFAVDFDYRDPVGPELTKTEQVPTDFKATWTDAEGVRQSLPFVNHH